MYTKLTSTKNSTRIIKYKTTQNPPIQTHKTIRTTTRSETLLFTSDYYRSLRRSFSRAKLLSFFNPDLSTFITLTYKKNQTNPTQCIQDFKNLIKADAKLKQQKNKQSLYSVETIKQKTQAKLKYIYVFETQKRGSIHFHIVATDYFETHINKNGHPQVTAWKHGYSSILHITDTDANFKPYLYLFKYMEKAQRVGKSFIHVSKNFDKITHIDYPSYIARLTEERLLFKEDYEFILNEQPTRIIKSYYDTRNAQH